MNWPNCCGWPGTWAPGARRAPARAGTTGTPGTPPGRAGTPATPRTRRTPRTPVTAGPRSRAHRPAPPTTTGRPRARAGRPAPPPGSRCASPPPPRPPERAPHTTLMAPAPPMLRHPLALQRALRPLRRRVDAPVGQELDERATADRIARLGADPDRWLPVLRPARERWLSLNLVYDAGPTMPVWRPLIHELHTALAQSGAFRTVTLYRADADGTVRGPDGQLPADGRTVTLLISDCMGPQWRQGHAGTLWYATLHRWARQMPLAVVQPLPEHLWRESALPAAPGRISAPHPVAPSAVLAFTPYDEPESGDGPGAVVLPVLEPEPRWLANWAGLISTPGGTRFPAAAARLTRPLPVDAEDRTDVGRLSAEELVLRFRATASPEAFRLAGHLAVGRPDLPVMRLVQAAVEPDPRPRHLAEVVLSGMLTALPGAPAGSYAFREGVRELLLLGLPRTERNRTVELLDRMGEFIDELAGRAPGGFRAVVPSGRGLPTPVEHEPVAMLSAESVRRLAPGATAELFAGRYRLLRPTAAAGTEDRGWVAEDTREGDTRVVVRTYPAAGNDSSFPELCRALSRVDHPGVARVLDHGVADGIPYLVREFVGGQTLHQRLAIAGPRGLSDDEVLDLLPPLAEAVLALLAQDGPHGALNTHTVVLGDRPVLACLDSAPLGNSGHGTTLRALGEITRALRSGVSAGLRVHLNRARANLLSGPEDQLLGAERLRDLPVHRTEDPTGILFTTDGLAGRPEARITLEAAVHEIFSRSLAAGQFQMYVRPDGYLMRPAPGAYVLPVLVSVLRELPYAMAGSADPPRLRVSFWPGPVSLPEPPAGIDVVVSPALYDEFAASSAARDAPPFEPLYADDAPDAPPLAWYCPLTTERPRRELVQGPFITQDLRELGVPTPGRTAVVHTRADGPLALLDPIRPYGGREPRAATYYTVDLTPQQTRGTLSLPSSGKAAFRAVAELSWQVGDPVALVRSGAAGVSALLLEHLRDAAARITARHPATPDDRRRARGQRRGARLAGAGAHRVVLRAARRGRRARPRAHRRPAPRDSAHRGRLRPDRLRRPARPAVHGAQRAGGRPRSAGRRGRTPRSRRGVGGPAAGRGAGGPGGVPASAGSAARVLPRPARAAAAGPAGGAGAGGRTGRAHDASFARAGAGAAQVRAAGERGLGRESPGGAAGRAVVPAAARGGARTARGPQAADAGSALSAAGPGASRHTGRARGAARFLGRRADRGPAPRPALRRVLRHRRRAPAAARGRREGGGLLAGAAAGRGADRLTRDRAAPRDPQAGQAT
nr:SAV_2336 N-terminal domain-related protein [Streptomyces sp. DconLS]